MGRSRRWSGRGDNPGQLQIDWSKDTVGGPVTAQPPSPVSTPPLVQYLPWDFQSTFPQPTPEAIDAGIISDEDAAPEDLRGIHEEHANEALAVLRDLDRVLDARRRGVDPRNNKPPMLKEAKERLKIFFDTEPGRLERWWQTIMETYEQAFGHEAADAFGKALRARHAGIPVRVGKPGAEMPTPAKTVNDTPAALPGSKPARERPHRRIAARLPVPRPLPSAIAAGHFGQDEGGRPIRPGAHEVREITEHHAEKLIETLDSLQQASGSCIPGEATRLRELFDSGIAAYAEDFGHHAAAQLEAYVRRQAGLDPSIRHER
jgi:hypothetical protein